MHADDAILTFSAHIITALHLTVFLWLLVLSGMFSDGFFSYGIEPVHNGSDQVIVSGYFLLLTSLIENLMEPG